MITRETVRKINKKREIMIKGRKRERERKGGKMQVKGEKGGDKER